MFYNATSFNQSLNNLNINNVTNMYGMFYHTNSFNKDNCKDWDLTNIQVKYIDK